MKRIFLIAILILALIFSSCAENDENIVGEWVLDGNVYSFSENGTATVNSQKFEYTAKDGVLELKSSEGTKTVKYSFRDGILTLNGVEMKRNEKRQDTENVISDYFKRYILGEDG